MTQSSVVRRRQRHHAYLFTHEKQFTVSVNQPLNFAYEDYGSLFYPVVGQTIGQVTITELNTSWLQ